MSAADVPRGPGRTLAVMWLGLVVVALALRLQGIGSQPLTADDYEVAVSAANYVETGHPGPTMWNHPGLRNLLVHASLGRFGATPLALKLPSLVLGTLSVLLLAVVALRLGWSPVAAGIAAGLLAIDALHVDFSRQAVHEVYTAAFGLAGAAAAIEFARGRGGARGEDWTGRRWSWLPVSGLLFGLGAASKWDALFPMAVVILFVTVALLRDESATRGMLAARVVVAQLAMVVPAALVYLATYGPVIRRGLGLADLAGLHLEMLRESRVHAGYSAYALEEHNSPLAWFVRPVGYADFVIVDGRPRVFLGVTNPLVWMVVLPAIVWLGREAWSRRSAARALPVAGFAAAWLPFVFLDRPVWVHSAFPAICWALLAVGRLVDAKLSRKALVLYLVSVAAVSLPLLVLARGGGYDSPLLRPLVESFRPSTEAGN